MRRAESWRRERKTIILMHPWRFVLFCGCVLSVVYVLIATTHSKPEIKPVIAHAEPTPQIVMVEPPKPRPAEKPKQVSRGEYNRPDVELLARVVASEATSQPYEGKVAVAAVVLNRIDSGRFPSTIKGVIYAPGQFQVVSNGSINRIHPKEDDFRAVKDAIAGYNPVSDAVYFCNPSTSTNRWMINHRKLVKRIGDHAFYK